MSKKPKKPRATTKQAATSQKSSRAVTGGDVEESKPKSADNGESPPDPVETAPDGAANASSTAPPVESKREPSVPVTAELKPVTAEPMPVAEAAAVTPSEQRAQGPVSSAPASHAIQYQSLIPPTDDIDVGWGSDDDGDEVAASNAPVLLAPNMPEAPVAQEPSKTAESAQAEVSATPASGAAQGDESEGVGAAKNHSEAAPAPPDSDRVPTGGSSAASVAGVARPSADSAMRRALTPADGVASVRSSAAPPSSPRTSAPIDAEPAAASSVTKGPTSVPEAGLTGKSGARRLAPNSAPPPSFTAPTSSRVPVGTDVAADSTRPSRAPSALRPSAPSPGPESRPSRAPGSPLPAGTLASAAENRPSRSPSALRPSVAPRSPTDTPVALEPSAPAASPSAASATPLAIQPPITTSVSPSHTPQSAPAQTQEQSEFTAPAVPVESTVSSFPPPTRNRAPLWVLLWLASLGTAGAVGWFAKPVPRAKPVVCDCTSKVQSALHEAMLQQPRSSEPAPAAAPAPSPTLTASPIEGTGGADSQSATTVASATGPSSTVPVVVETKSKDRIDVLVKSRPSNVKVWRLGRAIGRTPLIIQIGRGEHRIFEVGGPAVGVRRLSLNGEKTEVTVDLIPPGKAAK